MNKKLFFLIAVLSIILVAVFWFGRTNLVSQLSKQIAPGSILFFVLVTIAALIDSISLCALSILILTIAFLFSLGRLRSDILKLGGFYIFGIFVTYVLIGLGILRVLQFFNTPHFMATVGAVILIGFGAITLINEFFPKFPVKLRIPHAAHHKIASLMEKASLPGAFLLGVIVGLCAFPCTGGPYLMILGLLHDHGTFLSGLAYLIFYNLVFVLPLAIILFIGSDKNLLGKLQVWRETEGAKMHFWSGVAMVILGLIIFAI